jgi:hypothetical protein
MPMHNQHHDDRKHDEMKHEEVRFERRDLSSKTILGSLFGLAVFVAVVYFVVLGTYRLGDWYEASHQTPQNPMAQPADADIRNTNPQTTTARIHKTFSEPRLETNERIENNDFRWQEEQKLHSYGWVDQQGGAVRIPIDRAMELIAQRGLNTTPRAGTTPESVVNTITAAAEKSDNGESNDSPQSAGGSKSKPGKGKDH